MPSPKTNISLIVAMAKNRVIGRDNALPWRMPADLRRFQRLTMGKPMIMGRRTWQSLPGLLPGRTHVVVTRDAAFSAPGAVVVNSAGEALDATADAAEIMVIGGGQLYAQMLPLASRIYLTRIEVAIDGDTFFPEITPEQWRELRCERHSADGKNPCDYTFIDLLRR